MPDEPKKRGRPKGSYSSKAITKAEGVAYVFLYGNELQIAWENEKIDIDVMEKLRANAKAQSIQLQLSNLIFPAEPPAIGALDENEEEADDVGVLLRNMAENPKVAFYERMKNYFNDSCYSCFFHSKTIENVDGLIQMTEFRELPASSFAHSNFELAEYGHALLFPGVVRDKEGNIHYYQMQEDGVIIELKNCSHLKPPGRDFDICGMPLFYSLVPWFLKHNFAWLAQMQSVNRVGAPSLVLKVTGMTKADEVTAKNILKNWGKNNSFSVPDRFEVIEVGKEVNDIALKSIEAINKEFSTHFSPSDAISSDGNLIGGSDQAKGDLYLNYIRGWHTTIAARFQPFLQEILDYNGYSHLKAYIRFPEPELKNAQLDLDKAKDAADRKVISKLEYRKKCGWGACTEDDLKTYEEEWGTPEQEEIQEDPAKEAVMEDEDIKDDQEKGKLKKNQLVINQSEDIIEETAAGIKTGWDDLINGFTKYLEQKVKT